MGIHELVRISSIYLPQSLAKLLVMESFHRLQPVAVWSACTLHAETQTGKGCVSGTGQLRGGSAEEVNLQRWQGGKAEKNCLSPGFCADLTSRNMDWYVIDMWLMLSLLITRLTGGTTLQRQNIAGFPVCRSAWNQARKWWNGYFSTICLHQNIALQYMATIYIIKYHGYMGGSSSETIGLWGSNQGDVFESFNRITSWQL